MRCDRWTGGGRCLAIAGRRAGKEILADPAGTASARGRGRKEILADTRGPRRQEIATHSGWPKGLRRYLGRRCNRASLRARLRSGCRSSGTRNGLRTRRRGQGLGCRARRLGPDRALLRLRRSRCGLHRRRRFFGKRRRLGSGGLLARWRTGFGGNRALQRHGHLGRQWRRFRRAREDQPGKQRDMRDDGNADADNVF